MPEISLRAYGREIDELIERERLDEAIAHCRYILQTYPKHLETYRHLGKAYLEAKRYGDAADIFQRVLSAVPDDFVSHVGMAIVREDEGNLDAAIWHMERAFETNPSNPAIQQEMKRLISRRDGLEPHKVRLTRGALARMYAHGELFAQAIAELRSALQEDPERPDLQVLLASMYWQTDQRSDATSVSNQILEKLPYCAEANRILAANLQAGDRIEEAAVYHRRLANLDPYAAFVESALADSKSVEESAVSMEKLDWVAGEPLPSAAPGQPGWATTLGMEMQEGAGDDAPESTELPQTGPLPSWLEPGEPPPFEAAAEKELRDEIDNQTADGKGDLPEGGFLDDLEAEVSDETGAYADGSSGEMSESEFLEGIEAADDKDLREPEPEEEDSEKGKLGFAAAAAGIVAGVLGKDDKEDSEAEAESEGDLDSDGGIAAASAIGVAAGVVGSGDEEEAAEESAPEDEAEAAPGMFAQAETTETSEPDGDLEPSGDELGIAEDDLMGVSDSLPGGEESPAGDGLAPDGAPEGDIPDWMQDAGWGESKGEFEDAPVSFSDDELHSLNAGEIPAEISAEAPADDDVDLTPAELPDWIQSIAPEESSDEAGDQGAPDWIGTEAPSVEDAVLDPTPPVAEIESGGESGDTEASVPAAESDTGEIPTWITDDPPGATESIVTWLEDRGPDEQEMDAAASEDLPDWMRDTGPLEDSLDDAAPPAEPPVDKAVGSEPSIEPPVADASQEEPSGDSPASDSWLTAVAAVAADDEASASTSDGDTDQAPEWLSEAMDAPEDSNSSGIGAGIGLAAAAAVGMVAGQDDEEPEPVAQEEAPKEVPELPQDITSSEGPEIEISDQEPEADAVSFAAAAEAMSELSSPTDEIESPEVEGIEASETSIADQFEPGDGTSAPDWLEEIGTLPEQPVETDSADWLEGLDVDGEESPAEPAADTPDWLKGLAEEGADGDESSGAPAADWLREIGDPGNIGDEEEVAESADTSAQDEPGDLVEEAVASGGAPDWLQGVGSASNEETPSPSDSEPEELVAETPPAPAEEDSEVMDWLHDLAAKQAEESDDEDLEATPQVEAAAPVIEDRDIPDAPEEGLEWLEQLADQRGMDVDVNVPGQPPPTPVVPEPEAELEPETAPGWLGRMATQPIPKVDMEALEAAARGEEVTPDAETIDAQAADVQAQLDDAASGGEIGADVPEASSDVAPDDITVEAHVGDLEAEKEQKAESDELVPAAGDGVSNEEIPDWLIAAAEQAEPPSEAPSGLPAEFADAADEPAESAVSEEIEVRAAEEAEPAASVEVESPEVTEPTADEVAVPGPAETAVTETAEDVEPVSDKSSASEAKKKEDMLERSRQALASGDTQSATELYGDLVKRKESLESVIEDLRIAVDRAPDNADLWQVLGDAYMRDDQTDEAIDAYRRGMEAV